MSIHNRVNEAYRFQVLSDFKKNKYLPQTPEGIVDFLFDEDSGYRVYHDKEQYNTTTLAQRLNRLWVVPCWLIMSPFIWLFTGSSGVDTHTKLGKWIAKVTGL